ncbi:MAG: EAL domain-containing protein [Gammaproteobacteria bacterium]
MSASTLSYTGCETNILIVDDEPKALESLSKIIELSGYQPYTADNVVSAIDKLQNRSIRLVLLDLKMPERDGHALLEFVAAQKLDVRILVISGEATFSQASRALRYDFVDEFIKKPYAVEALLRSIEKAEEQIKRNDEQRRIQAQVLKSEQIHRFFIDMSPDIVYMLNEQGEFVFLNNTIETMLGYDKNEIKGKHYSVLVIPEDIGKAKYAFNERRTGTRATKAVELRLRCKHCDTPKYVETDAITIVLSSKGIYKKHHDRQLFVGTYGVIRDINDRKISENTVKKLNLAVENSPNLIMITDYTGTIEYVNPKIAEISGYSADEVIGHKTSLFSSDQTPIHEYQAMWQTISAGKVWRGVLKNKKKNGELYWSQQAIAPMLGDDGRITHFISIQEDVTEALKLSEQISYRATHDPLTDLINRSEFDRRLKRVVQTARTQHSEHVLCYLDLDQFKLVNDTCNHIAGDELLRQISRALSQLIRQRDTLARLGGDEFAILMEHCSLDQAQKTAEKLHKMIEKYQFRWEGHSFRIGVSIGLVAINAESGGFDTILKQADTACYMAKEAGRNRTHIFAETDHFHSLQNGNTTWCTKINYALENNDFKLYKQSIMALSSATGEHYEILIRMADNGGNIVAPGAFLPAADRYQLSPQIDRWVIRNLFEWFANNRDRLDALAMCSINLSAATLNDDHMIDFIARQFDEARIPASKICFELKESATIANLNRANHFIKSLKERGCCFCLDDFGSGLSSFAYLKSLPIDFLKIDGIFVKDIANDPVDLAMVRSINDIAHVMGKKTIAEFVENQAILNLIKTLNVDYAQGYCHDVPVPLR